MTTGTYSLADLRKYRFASAAEFGLDTINKVVSDELAYWNANVNEQMNFLAEPLTEQSRIYGTSAKVAMQELDEFGRAKTQKNLPGQTVSFPIRTYGQALGWTEQYMAMKTPADVVEQLDECKLGHAEELNKQMKKAIFNDTNYDFVDPYNGVTLGIKRLINADSSTIPNAPDGTTFDGASHTHYVGTTSGSFAAADLNSAVSNITEHGITQGIKIFVNGSNLASVAALSGYTALSSNLFNYGGTTSTVQKLDYSDVSNFCAGIWDGKYEVWVKNLLVPANYILVAATGASEKVLGFRQLAQPSLQGFRIKAQFSNYPMIAEVTESIFGYGIWNRLGAVCLSKTSTWSNPTIS